LNTAVPSNQSDLTETIFTAGLFESTWYAAVHADVGKSGLSPDEHFRVFGVLLRRMPCPDFAERLVRLLRHLVTSSKLLALTQHYFPSLGSTSPASTSTPPEFDEAFYLQTNPGIDLTKFPSTYDHFLKWGFRDLRNPSPDFDLVWYTQNYGHEFSSRDENPFLHYLHEGKSRGNIGHPPRPVRFDASFSRALPTAPVRACLFASYDPHLRIDDYVLVYLRELSRHADVFFLTDCDMPSHELAKLDGIVKGAWAERHGAYDFGSYSRLARDLVGWDRLASYDEVLFINDSCYLVRPLDEVFTTMDARPCAWWGLQATKRIASTRATQPFPGKDPISVSDLYPQNYLDRFEFDPVYDFLLGSFFLAFRRDVIADQRFQSVINSVVAEKKKSVVIRKYEIGITRFLIGLGYNFESWVPKITDRMPVYTEIAYELIRRGYPLFKRLMITENPYKVSSLAYWPTVIQEAQSLTPVEMIEKNVHRLANADKIYDNYNYFSEGMALPKPYSRADFEAYDGSSPKYDHYWGFPVCHLDHTLCDNSRAIFEAVKNDPQITKLIFTRGSVLQTDGVNVITMPLKSLEGQLYLARCRHIFVRNDVELDVDWPLAKELHNVINILGWRSIEEDRLCLGRPSTVREKRTADYSRLKAAICASDVDHLATISAYWPLTFNDVWLTGIPRHDFITAAEKDLPPFLTTQLEEIRTRKAGRRMVLFCPAFRNNEEHCLHRIEPNDVDRLSNWLDANGYVLGVRERPYDKNVRHSTPLRGAAFIELPAKVFPDVSMLLREADMLITDYSSVFIDYMLTGRPAISYADDRKKFAIQEPGLFSDLSAVFSGAVVDDFDSLMDALEATRTPSSHEDAASFQRCLNYFLKFTDGGNAARVVKSVKGLNHGSTLATGLVKAKALRKGKTAVFLYNPVNASANRFRIFTLLPELRKLGWTCFALDYRHASLAIVGRADILSICRLEQSSLMLDIVEGAKACGAKVIYDIGDLIFDSRYFSEFALMRTDPQRANFVHKQSHNIQLLMKMVDGFTLSTASLDASVAAFGKPTEVVANSLSTEILARFAVQPSRRVDGLLNIVYSSETDTDSPDFGECFAALATVLPEFPQTVLHIAGPMTLPDTASAALLAQTRQHGSMSYLAMNNFLHAMDINLAPLSPSPFNDAKSELKIVEAALHLVPTIASPSATYGAAITPWKTGVLAANQADWTDALRKMVANETLRMQIGQNAHREIVPRFTAAAAARILATFMDRFLDVR